MQGFCDLWEGDLKKAEQSNSDKAKLLRRCMIFWRVLKVCFDVVLKYARCLSGPNFLLFFLGLHKHVNILEREKATLKQQVEELQKKLEAAEER